MNQLIARFEKQWQLSFPKGYRDEMHQMPFGGKSILCQFSLSNNMSINIVCS